MSREEQKLDELLKGIMQSSGLENPPSDNYTAHVMSGVEDIYASRTRRRLLIMGYIIRIAAVLAPLLIFGLGYLGWTSGFFQYISGVFGALGEILPFGIPTWVLLAGAGYLFVIRGIIIFSIVNQLKSKVVLH